MNRLQERGISEKAYRSLGCSSQPYRGMSWINKDQVHPLEWGRIDSCIDQRTIFLERRIDILAERLDQLLKQQPSVELVTQQIEEPVSCRIA